MFVSLPSGASVVLNLDFPSGVSFHLGQDCSLVGVVVVQECGFKCIKLAPFWRVQRETPHGTPFQA